MNKLKIVLQCNKIFIALFLLLVIYVIVFTKIIKYHSVYDGTESTITGTITSLSINGNALKLEIKAKELIKATYYIQSIEEKEFLLEKVKLGTTVKLEGSLIEQFHNTIPNTFDYKEYLYSHKIFYTFNITSYELNDKNNLFYKIKDALQKRIYSMNDNEYLLIFLLGDKALVDSAEYTSFQLNGTAHLLAISGMHIALLIKAISLFLGRINKNKKVIITTIVLSFFAFLTGFSASVGRVIIFYVLINLNKIRNWNLSNLQILFLTALILIGINPFIIYDYGFLYSIIITTGIIYYSDKLKGNYLVQLIKLSTITFLFSLPITASLNYEINLMSIIANLIFVPLVSFAIYPLSLISIIFTNPLWKIAIHLLVKASLFFEKISIVVNIPKMPIILILSFYICLLLMKKRKIWVIGLLLILLINKSLSRLDSNYNVYFLDIGQGDSSLLISPYQKEVIMIDTGGKITYQKEEWEESNKNYNLSDNTIKFLKSLGITMIDYLIISHGDADHAKEAIHIIEKLKVKNVVLNQGELNAIEKEIINKKVNIVKNYQLKDFKIYNLNDKIYDNENDNSIINYIKINNYSLLFLGDASKKVEEYILKKYDVEADFVKIGHHGSKTSTSDYLLNQKFTYAFISSGRNNRFAHPSKETIEKLKKYKKKYYNTQDSGTIHLQISKNNYNISTNNP